MSQIREDFKSFMLGGASFESAALIPTECSTNLEMDDSTILEIREDRAEVEEELSALIEEDGTEQIEAIVKTTSQVASIADAAPAMDAVNADVFVPMVNASMESFSKILDVTVPRLNQQLNGQISVESIDSLRGWVSQAATSFKASLKNFFARIGLWWKRTFITVERLRKRSNSIRARMGSRKGQGGVDLKLGKYAATLVQGDGYAADPLTAMNAEAAMTARLSQVLLAAQQGVESTLSSRLDTLLQTDRPASAVFRTDLGKVFDDLEAAIKSQPPHLLGNRNLVTDKNDGDYILLNYVAASPYAEMVAKNAGSLRSLSPDQVSAYLDAIDVVLDNAIATIRGIEKESARLCRTAETAVERVASKFISERDMTQETVDADGRPTITTVTETSSSIGRVMETEYEIVEVINGLSWTINTVMVRLLYVTSSVLTLVEESVIQD